VTEPVLVVDIGTASTKAVLATPDGEIIARARRDHGLELPRPGRAEQDADRVWCHDVVEVVRELVHDARDAIAAVCVSGLGPGLASCDSRVRPLRRAIRYGIDTRAADEIAELNALRSRLAPRARGLAVDEPGDRPEAAAAPAPRSRRVGANRRLVQRELVRGRAADRRVRVDHHTASQSDQPYPLEREGWDQEWAAELSPGVPLPSLVAGRGRRQRRRDRCVRDRAPVRGPGDGRELRRVGRGAQRRRAAAGDLMLVYGSTMFVVRVARPAVPDAGLWTTVGIDPGIRTHAAGMAISGSLTAWFSELWGGADSGELASAATGVPPGARRLLVLSFAARERSLIFDPDLRGVIAGLTVSHGRAELSRAVYEGIAYSVRHNPEVMDAAAGPTRRVVAIGGGTQARLWMEIVSSVAGLSQETPAEAIGAAYGDGLLAASGAGRAPDATDWSRVTDVIEPDAGSVEPYRELFARYLELHDAVAPISHRLAEFGRGETALEASII
jgi:xylulokinase